MQLGIVGLPYSGKTTLFQAVTRTHLDANALAKTEPHLGVVKVPDVRLDRCSALFSPKSTVYATIQFVDIPGLKKVSTAFLSAAKTNDALVNVVRLFGDDPQPLRDIETFDAELILSDMAILEARVDKIRKQIDRTHDDQMKKELPVVERCLALVNAGTPLRNEEFAPDELHLLKAYQLLTLKPMLIALSLDESQLASMDDEIARVASKYAGPHTRVVAFFGKIDMEMSELSGEDAQLFMQEYGIRESALDTLIREAYALLGLQSFLTVGEDECRAWTIRAGMNAQEAAGAIHSDFVTKFIRAEVVHYDDFIAANGSFAKAKEAGHWRVEGKNYIVRDGDILNIRHS